MIFDDLILLRMNFICMLQLLAKSILKGKCMDIASPIVFEVSYKKDFYEELINKVPEDQREYIDTFPTIYIIHDKDKSKYSAYVGETTNIRNRTYQHLNDDIGIRSDFSDLKKSSTSKMFVIGHEHFNKSLTLDIENRLIHYLSSIDNVEINNRRYNQQNSYYPVNELDQIFPKIWNKLHRFRKDLFPLEKIIRDSALFKASPFHKLTNEQLNIRQEIISKITTLLSKDETGQLIMVEGEAGSGKTVLMSSLFYELNQLSRENSENQIIEKCGQKQYLLVNHNQQLIVYQQLAKKLGLTKQDSDIVSKPTKFINSHDPSKPVDIVIIDEAHLLWTQGKQSYRGENQLQDILDRAKVVIVVFDKNQILSREQFVENKDYTNLLEKVKLKENYFYLGEQLRINAEEYTVNWIREIIDNQKINPIRKDSKYDLIIFNDVEEMYERLKVKSKNDEAGISRLLATFDWEYINGKKPENKEFWKVKIGGFELPWNLQLKKSKKDRDKSWAEQEQTINEVGSTFTIQGFDLNYAGVIIGPSVSYRDGEIIFDPSKSKNKKATQKRTLKDGSKEEVSDLLLKNELNVLLTRGVNGLYIYAVDKYLREALLKAQEG